MPQVLMHKKTGDLILGTEWWEPLKLKFDLTPEEIGLAELVPQSMKNNKMCAGNFMQVGWLIQNRHDVWFGVNTIDDFEALGEP